MTEETKTTAKKGRPPKTKSIDTTTNDNKKTVENSDDIIAKLMAQMEEQSKAMAELQKQVNDANKEKTDLQDLVDVLKDKNTNTEKDLPKKVKVVNLLANTLNLSTMPMGMGKVFNFEKFGSMVTMKTSDLEDILSIPAYRRQAEEGLFYICDSNIVDDQDLTEEYKKIYDKNTIEYIVGLTDDACVDMFVGLNDEMKDSLSTKMAEDIINGKSLDRNRLAEIQMRTTIDIEQMAKDLKDIKEKLKK